MRRWAARGLRTGARRAAALRPADDTDSATSVMLLSAKLLHVSLIIPSASLADLNDIRRSNLLAEIRVKWLHIQAHL